MARFSRRRRFRGKRRSFRKRRGFRFRRRKPFMSRVRTLVRNTPIEYKHQTATTSLTPSWNGGTLTILNGIAAGNTDLTRVGDSMNVINLTLRGVITSTATAACRLIIWWAKRNIGALILQDILSVTGALGVISSDKEYDNRFVTKFLYDKKWTFSTNGTLCRTFSTVIKINKRTQFLAGTTQIQSGELRWVLIGDRAVGVVTFNLVRRLTWTG